MSKALIPELHDIAKLWRVTEELKATLNLESAASQDVIASLPGRLGLAEPATESWRGIVEHQRGDPARAAGVFLLVVADHAGSNLSRVVRRAERGWKAENGGERYRSVYKLWRPTDQRDLALLTSIEEVRSLVEWLATDPEAADLFGRYGALLDERPEELQPPWNTTSLASHLTIVGKIYRFLDRGVTRVATPQGEAWEFYGKGRTRAVESAENSWPVDLIKADVRFPQQIVRTRDMSLFDLMARTLQALSQEDRVLVATFNQVLALLAPDEKVEDVFAPLLDAGLVVAWERARTTVGRLSATPAHLREEEKARARKAVSGVPEPHRAQALARRWEAIEGSYPRGTSHLPLAERFPPPICDLCQMEQATTVWPPDPEMAGPREQLGPRCAALRQNASRLYKLDRWTEEPTIPVAWILVNLDLDRLAAFLGPLYRAYAKQIGWTPEQIEQIDVRPPLLAEFQKDYHRFLGDWAASVEATIGAENVEHVGGETGAAANTLLCVRLGELRRIPTVLDLYLRMVTRYFPAAVQRRTPAPFRFALSVSGVKFPFSEHWRMMQEAEDDILVNLVGRGRLAVPLASLPALIAAGQPGNRKALHNLAEVARMSEALAEVYAQDRGEGHYRQYETLITQMRPLGMTYESLLTYAKMLEGE